MFDMPSLSESVALRKKILELNKKLSHARTEISHLKQKLKIIKGKSKKLQIIKLIEDGVTPICIIREHGFNKYYVYEIYQYYQRTIKQ